MHTTHYIKLLYHIQCRLNTHLTAIDRIIIFEGIDTGYGEGHNKAYDCNGEAISYGILENLSIRGSRCLESEIEIKRF